MPLIFSVPSWLACPARMGAAGGPPCTNTANVPCLTDGAPHWEIVAPMGPVMTSELVDSLVQLLSDRERNAQPAGTLIVKSPEETVRSATAGSAPA